MNISFTFKNFEASEHLKKYARRRMEKLGRFFGKAAGLEVGVVLTVDKIRNRCEVTVVGEGLHLAASPICRLLDCVRNLLGLAIAQTYVAVAVADYHQRRKGKTPTALYNLGATIDVNYFLYEFGPGIFLHPLFFEFSAHFIKMLEVDAVLTYSVSEALNATVILAATAVKHDCQYVCGFHLCAQCLAEQNRSGLVGQNLLPVELLAC